MSLIFVLNFVVMVLSLKWARDHFEQGENTLGWLNLFISSMNLAAVLLVIL